MALSDIFAPAYISSDPSSVAAVNDWMARNFSMTNPKVEQTRMPVSFNTGNPAGEVDPEALRVLAQGGPYDMDARRNAIAAQVQAQQAAAAQAAAQQQQQQQFGGYQPMMSGGPYSGGGPVAAGLAPPQVMLGVS